MKNIDLDAIILEFVEDSLFLKEYTKVGTLHREDFDKKIPNKLGSKINKNLKLILKSKEGIDKFKSLLEHDNAYIRYLAARYLYPVMEDESLKMMKTYKNSLTDEMEILEANMIIEGLTKKQKFFMEQFVSLYGCDIFNQSNNG